MSVGQLSTVGELGGGEGVGLFYGAVFSEKPRPLAPRARGRMRECDDATCQSLVPEKQAKEEARQGKARQTERRAVSSPLAGDTHTGQTMGQTHAQQDIVVHAFRQMIENVRAVLG